MAKQPQEGFQDLKFPLCGVDLSNGFGQQSPRPLSGGGYGMTTPVGQNVRAYDAMTQRGRGGSRPGLEKYATTQLNGSALIQELNCVVGVGYSPPGAGAAVSGITFLQEYTEAFGASASARTVTLPVTTTAGSLLVVFVGQGQSAVNTDTVTDSQGNSYTRSTATYASCTNGTIRHMLFWACNIVGGACTITVTPTASVQYHITVLEYSGVLSALPVDSVAVATGTSTTPRAGSCTVTTAGTLVVSGFIGFVNPAASVNSPFTLRAGVVTPSAVSADDVNAQASEECIFTQTISDQWVAIATSFKPANRTFASTQSSQSGRIVTLVGVSGGTVKALAAGATAWGSVTSGAQALATTGVIRSASINQKLYFADGANWKLYTPATNAMSAWTASAGSLPGSNLSPVDYPRLIANWRGRCVVSAIRTDPQNWFMSAQSDPTNWDYAPTPFVSTQAIAGNNGPQGVVGDVVTCLIPYSDDVLIFGCDHSIFMMRGDPMAGGSLDLVTDTIGMAFGNPWCKGPDGTLYFFSNKMGIYAMTPGQSKPMRMSGPIEQLLSDLDTGSNVIRMLWDDLWQGFHVFISWAASAKAAVHFFWEGRTGAWWSDVFTQKNHNPLCCTTFDGNLTSDRRSLIGSWDGYVRNMSPEADTDDGVPIASSVLLGPLLTKDFDAVMFRTLQAVLGSDSGAVTFSVYVGPTAEAALSSTAVLTGTLTSATNLAGRNLTRHIHRSAHALWVKLSSTKQWALEGVRASVAGRGKVARRGV